MLAIISQIPIVGQGGVEILVRALAKELSACCQVFLLSPDSPADFSGLELDQHVTDYLQVDRERWDERVAEEWSQWLHKRSIKTLHFHFGGPYSWGAFELGGGLIPRLRKRGFRIYVTNHQAVSPFSASKRDIPVYRRLAAHAKRMPGKLRQLAATEREFLVSDHDLRVSRRWYPTARGKFGRIYHSILDQQTAVPSLPESRVILCLATLCFRKGQHILTESFAKLTEDHPDWILKLVGMPVERECVEAIVRVIESHGLEERVQLPGPSNQPWEEITAAEIYVQPSLLEGLGLSLQEAAFAGRPCIGSDTGGIPELIENGISGVLVPPGDVASLTKALGDLMKSRETRIQYSATARAGVEKKE